MSDKMFVIIASTTLVLAAIVAAGIIGLVVYVIGHYINKWATARTDKAAAAAIPPIRPVRRDIANYRHTLPRPRPILCRKDDGDGSVCSLPILHAGGCHDAQLQAYRDEARGYLRGNSGTRWRI